MDLLIENILMSGYGSAGQRCLAISNIACVPEIHDELVERLLDASKGVTLGDASDESVLMGPLFRSVLKIKIESYIEIGLAEGATLLVDGRNPDMAESNKEGYFIGPTIFTDVTPEMRISKEEIFGPVLSIHKLGCIDRVLDAISDHVMGNGAVIFPQNRFYTEKFIQEADVGMVGVNVGICAPHPYLPFGGIKGSLIGNNKVQGKDVVDFFTQNKVATIRVVDPAIGEVNTTNKDNSIRSSVAD